MLLKLFAWQWGYHLLAEDIPYCTLEQYLNCTSHEKGIGDLTDCLQNCKESCDIDVYEPLASYATLSHLSVNSLLSKNIQKLNVGVITFNNKRKYTLLTLRLPATQNASTLSHSQWIKMHQEYQDRPCIDTLSPEIWLSFAKLQWALLDLGPVWPHGPIMVN